MKKIFLIIGIFYLNFSIGNSQNSDKYIIVLDVQPQFYTDKKFDSSATVMVQNINALVEKFNPDKVVYVKSTGKALGVSYKGLSIDTLPAPKLDSNLKIVSQNIFTKISGDAFEVAELNDFINNNNINEIIIVGLLAEKCVYNTALGGKVRGYNIYIIPEAIIGKTLKRKEEAIKKMTEKGINILPIKEILKVR